MAATRKKGKGHPQLTAERVRDEALRLIEEEGLEGFSTRKLGRALGVEAMAIYWYYPSKEALLDAVVEALVSQMEPPEPDGDFIDALRKLAHSYRGIAHSYPAAFPLLATRRFATEGTYRFLDGLFTMAHDFGFDDRATARWFRLVSSYCSGVALDELAGIKEAESNGKAGEGRSQFERLGAVFQWLTPEHHTDIFSFGLEVLLEAIKNAPKSKNTGRAKRKAR